MGRKITGSVGLATVEISGDLEDMLMGIIDDSSKRVLKTLQAYDEKIIADAKKEWPVRTGRSRDGFRVATKIDANGTLRVSITNLARSLDDRNPRRARYYRIYRRPIEEGAGGTYWSILVQKPWRKGIKNLIKELGDDLLEAARRP